MSLKEKLETLKMQLSNLSPSINKDYEFNAELEDHQIGNQNVYRLYYINYHRIGEGYEKANNNNIGIINWPFKPFMFPDGISREDGFKILSYLTDYIEKKGDIVLCSCKSVATLDNVLNLKRLGFKRFDDQIDDKDIINLYTVTGRLLLFKKSEHYQKYFEWYKEGITLDEVKAIYNKCGIEFYDLVLIENTEEDNENLNNAPQLIKKK